MTEEEKRIAFEPEFNRDDCIYPIQSFKGLVFTKIEVCDYIIRFSTDTEYFVMFADKDCCFQLMLEDWKDEDFNALIGVPILYSEIVKSAMEKDEGSAHYWTFYKLRTKKGYVTLRWSGSDNGYYSSVVRIYREDPRLTYGYGDCVSEIWDRQNIITFSSKEILDESI